MRAAELRTSGNEVDIRSERLRTALRQIPAAVLVTVVNAALMTVLLEVTEPKRSVFIWLGSTIAIAVARFCLWWSYRQHPQVKDHYGFWCSSNVCGAFAAGLAWGVGSVLLLPAAEEHQLFWVFLIGGMSAGAASIHYPHWPTAACFIAPAALPLAIHFGLDGSERQMIAAAMIIVFVTALLVTSRAASRSFGEKLELQHALARHTRELDALNEKLQIEIAEHQATAANLHHVQKMEAVGRLTGALAHDFNNLLTAVLGSLTLLQKRLPAEDARAARLLETAVQGAERGAALTQRLLAFGRRQPLMPRVVDVATLVHNMAPLLGSVLGDNVSLLIHFPTVLSAVEIDINQLELALLNLAANSRDAMPNGGTFSIEARAQQVSSVSGSPRPGSYVVLSVSDNGAGMDEATLARATEPFFTTKGIGKGTGLGLSMVYGFAAQSGGELVLRSKQDIGTVAELWLPCASTASAPAPALSKHIPIPQTRCGTVLVVDDDRLVLASTAEMLEDLGYTPIEAMSGQEALKRYNERCDIDLVIVDYSMPGMTGLQLLDELRRKHPQLPMILATGYSDLQAYVAEVEPLAKPFTQASLASAIDRSLSLVSSSG
jgi:signal transduction histidine kinase/CheY-like chemotaxis protein